jgi:hypothetical protein
MEVLPGVGLKLRVPVKDAGILRLPPRSEPNANGTQLEATSPASPPELPPQDLRGFSGFKDMPHTLFSVCTDRTPYNAVKKWF